VTAGRDGAVCSMGACRNQQRAQRQQRNQSQQHLAASRSPSRYERPGDATPAPVDALSRQRPHHRGAPGKGR
jgi:hypothetical protein